MVLVVVKRLYIILEDEEYDRLLKEKGRRTWKEFLFDLLELKRKVTEEGELITKNALKEPYLDLAKTLRKLGSLIKIVYEERDYKYREDWEYEAAALLPLFVAGEKLNEEEKRELGVVAINALWQILDELYPSHSEELKWLAQALRMLARGVDKVYDLSIDNFIKARSRRRESTSSD